jgi:hypothetical protein
MNTETIVVLTVLYVIKLIAIAVSFWAFGLAWTVAIMLVAVLGAYHKLQNIN